jgi:hypothetical protein
MILPEQETMKILIEKFWGYHERKCLNQDLQDSRINRILKMMKCDF